MSSVVDARRLDLKVASAAIRAALTSGTVTVRNADHLHGLGAGLRAGEIIVEGDAGDYVGVLNAGGTVRVIGDAGKYIADNMTAGTVIVEGDADYGVGSYCYGGMVVVKGNAGDFTAVMNKGATIIVGGNVGDEVATYMLAGDLVILGNAGRSLANYLIRGNVFIAGGWESLGHNTLVQEPTSEDVERICAYLADYGLEADPSVFKKIVRLTDKPFYK
ncbi:MAG TPA: tributyrin esterase [Chloroflexi bacterium]|nr:tributyrin esterase [Chloroflexota bacterium]